MTVKEEFYVLNKTCPLLHVSSSNLVGCIDLLAYADPHQQCATVTLVPLVLTGPPKVENVTFANNTVKDGKIHQEVKWNALEFRHNTFQQYVIRYGVSLRSLLSRDNQRTFSSESLITLELNFNPSNITYYVQVAVKPMKKMFRGDFSDLIGITYTSEYIHIIWI